MSFKGSGHGKPVIHDKTRGMIKETSRDRFYSETKEMEHEFQGNKTTLEKALHENYRFEKETLSHHVSVIHLVNDQKKHIKVRFEFEENLNKLRPMFNSDHH